MKSLVCAAALLSALFVVPARAQDFLAGVVSIDVTMTRSRGETCIASQYGVGDKYNGRRTASGSIFNTYATMPYTLAHKTLPFGTMVTVTNLSNGRSIRAKVSDRGPFIRGRCVDLGRAGANALGMGGTARVSVSR